LQKQHADVATVLLYSRFALAAYAKSVPAEQLSQQISNYNDAILKWEADFGLYSIRLRSLFNNEETLKQGNRSKLDMTIGCRHLRIDQWFAEIYRECICALGYDF
jgi:hypothetical protein